MSEEASETSAINVGADEPRALGFWASIFWLGGAAVTGVFAAFVAAGVLDFLVVPKPAPEVGEQYLAPFVLAAIVAVLIVGVRRAGWSAQRYFVLVKPGWRTAAIALAGGAAFPLLDIGAAFVSDSADSGLLEDYEKIYAAGALPMFWFNAVVVAAIVEETIFRGFLYRSWSQTRLGHLGAVVLTAIVFGAAHFQYGWLGGSTIGVSGVFLGWLRWRSQSLVPPILAHAAANANTLALLALLK